MSWQIFSSSVTLLILYQSNIDKKGIDEISLKMTSPFDFVIYLIIQLRFKRNSIYDIKHRGFLECLPIFVQCFDYFLSIKVWYLFNYLTNCRNDKNIDTMQTLFSVFMLQTNPLIVCLFIIVLSIHFEGRRSL